MPELARINVLDGQGHVILLAAMGDQTTIVNAARISFNSQSDEFLASDKKLLFYLLENKHTSPFEHVLFSFRVKCPLFVARQWMRHRTWSFNEVSRRYTSSDLEFYFPSQLRLQSSDNKQATDGNVPDSVNTSGLTSIVTITQQAIDVYNNLLLTGVGREQARMILPQNMMTEFWATIDLHNLMHFIRLRSHNHAQLEIREYSDALLTLIKPYVPDVADWLLNI